MKKKMGLCEKRLDGYPVLWYNNIKENEMNEEVKRLAEAIKRYRENARGWTTDTEAWVNKRLEEMRTKK